MNISKEIVENVNSKEFEGKDNVNTESKIAHKNANEVELVKVNKSAVKRLTLNHTIGINIDFFISFRI